MDVVLSYLSLLVPTNEKAANLLAASLSDL